MPEAHNANFGETPSNLRGPVFISETQGVLYGKYGAVGQWRRLRPLRCLACLSCCAALASFTMASFGVNPAPVPVDNVDQPGTGTRAFIDSAGRGVQVPESIERIYAAGPPAAIMLYTLAPQKLIGWNRGLTPEQLAFIPQRYRDLPELGRLTGRGNTANVEVVLKARPDVILDYGSLRRTFVSLSDRVQEQTGIPYVLLDGRFTEIPQMYRLLGRLAGDVSRAAELAAYAERTTAEVAALLARVPPRRRPRVYIWARTGRARDRARRIDQRGVARARRRGQRRGGGRRTRRTGDGIDGANPEMESRDCFDTG